MGWKVVDPIQRIRVDGRVLVARFRFARTTGFATQYGFPMYPDANGYPKPFPHYSQIAYRVIGDGISPIGNAQAAIQMEQNQMIFWSRRSPPGGGQGQWPADNFFVSGIGPGLRPGRTIAAIYGVGWTTGQVSFPASEGAGAWVNYVSAALRRNTVLASTGITPASFHFHPVSVSIPNAFQLLSIEPG